MSFFTDLFHAQTKKNWQNLANQIGGDFIEGGFLGKDSIELSYRATKIILDTHTIHGEHPTTYTRIFCPFISKNYWDFYVKQKNFLTKLGKYIGIDDVQIGENELDDKLYFTSENHEKLIHFFNSNQIKNIYLKINDMFENWLNISISNDSSVFSFRKRPPNQFHIQFKQLGIENDTNKMLLLFDLCKLTLDRLIEIGEAEDIDPNIQ
jgi:hypothetical protein